MWKYSVGGEAKSLAHKMKKSVKTIYKMFTDLSFCIYTRFLKWLFRLYDVNPSGALFLFEDLCARFHAYQLQFQLGEISEEEWQELVAACVEETAQAVKAALLSRDPVVIIKEITEGIASFRKLLLLLPMRKETAQRKAA